MEIYLVVRFSAQSVLHIIRVRFKSALRYCTGKSNKSLEIYRAVLNYEL